MPTLPHMPVDLQLAASSLAKGILTAAPTLLVHYVAGRAGVAAMSHATPGQPAEMHMLAALMATGGLLAGTVVGLARADKAGSSKWSRLWIIAGGGAGGVIGYCAGAALLAAARAS